MPTPEPLHKEKKPNTSDDLPLLQRKSFSFISPFVCQRFYLELKF